MGKARTKKARAAAKATPYAWLDTMDTDALQLGIAMRAKGADACVVNYPSERDECLEWLYRPPFQMRATLGRAHKSNAFKERLADWRAIVARGEVPVFERVRYFWIEKTETDVLRLICLYEDMSMDGERDELVERILCKARIDNERMFRYKDRAESCLFDDALETLREMRRRNIKPNVNALRYGLWAHDLEEDEVRMLCVYAGIDATATHEAMLEVINDDLSAFYEYKRLIGTPLWDDRMDRRAEIFEACRAGNAPPVVSVYNKSGWLHEMQTHKLKLMCAKLGIEITGSHEALFLRLCAIEDIGRYSGYTKTSWWSSYMRDRNGLERYFSNYKPDGQAARQMMCHSAPTDDSVRQAWLGCTPVSYGN